jgi:hypothetical protein
VDEGDLHFKRRRQWLVLRGFEVAGIITQGLWTRPTAMR